MENELRRMQGQQEITITPPSSATGTTTPRSTPTIPTATVPKTPASISAAFRPHSAQLYQDLKKPEESDVWNQLEKANKIKEEEEWLKVDASQRPVQEMNNNNNNDNNQENNNSSSKKRKHQQTAQQHSFKLKLEYTLDTAEKSSLFYRYWTDVQARNQPKEFDGRLETD